MNATKIILMPVLILSMIIFVQCTEDPYFADSDETSPASALKAGSGGGGHTETVGNNLSFPAIAADGFTISTVPESFLVPYTGTYPGIDEAVIDELKLTGPWYPQKTDGNTWQAEFEVAPGVVNVSFIDWGDNIESVNPKIRRPFRLEVTLYKSLSSPMTAYKMAELEYPSSSRELQGTNTQTYDNYLATVVSGNPKLVVQFLDNYNHDYLFWDVTDYRWKIDIAGDIQTPSIIPVTFSPELNVGGKYIYGASQGGWKPTVAGYYRITFYAAASNINLGSAVIGNASAEIVDTRGMKTFSESDEGGVADPVVVPEHNLTYVDVLVVAGGGR